MQISDPLSAVLLLLDLVSFALSVLGVPFDVVRRVNGTFQILLYSNFLLWLFLSSSFIPKLIHNILLPLLHTSCRYLDRYVSV